MRNNCNIAATPTNLQLQEADSVVFVITANETLLKRKNFTQALVTQKGNYAEIKYQMSLR